MSSASYRLEARAAGRAPVARTVQVAEIGDSPIEELRLLAAGRVQIRVVDAAGAPVVGTTLVLALEGLGKRLGHTDDSGQWTVQLETTAVLSVRPSAERRFAIPAMREVSPDDGVVQVVLLAARHAQGTVVDDHGAPLPGAFLDVFQDGQKAVRVRADDNGEFEVLVPFESTADLVLTGMSFVDGKIRRTELVGRLDGVRAGDRGLTLNAKPQLLEQSVEVRVSDPSDAPLAGVRVWASGPLGKHYAEGRTDAKGRVRLTELPAREIRLWADVTGVAAAGAVLNGGPKVVVPDGSPVELRLDAAVTISGVVIDQANPTVTAVTVLAVRGGRVLASCPAGSDGSFELRVPAALVGKLTIRARQLRGDGSSRNPNSPRRREVEALDVLPGTSGLRLELPTK